MREKIEFSGREMDAEEDLEMQGWSFIWGITMGVTENSERIMEYGIRKCTEFCVPLKNHSL